MPTGTQVTFPVSPAAPASIEPLWDDITGATANVYNGDQQFFYWGVGPCQISVTMPPMQIVVGRVFAEFLEALQGQLNYFQFPTVVNLQYAEFLMNGASPRYWRLKSNQRTWQVPKDRYYRFSFECREAF